MASEYYSADRYQSLSTQLAIDIESKIKKQRVTGTCVALLDENEIVWQQGFGFSHKDKAQLVTVDTIFKAGSISKVFTATAIMQLAEKNQLDIDDSIQKYIPELKPLYHFTMNERITLRHIMTHCSGLIGDQLDGMFTRKPIRFDKEIDFINRTHSPYAPNTIAAYSNLATDLLGVVIERVSGLQFEAYMQRYILQPLDMQDSTFRDSNVNLKQYSAGYFRGKQEDEPLIRNIPAGNLYSTTGDLLKFAKTILNKGGIILKPDSLQRMLTPQIPDHVLNMGLKFGLNWVVEKPTLDYLGKVYWHNGGTIHFMSQLTILPDQGLAAVVLSNSSMSMPFVDSIGDDILIQASKLKNNIEPLLLPSPNKLSKEKSEDLLTDLSDQIVSDYATGIGPLRIYRIGNKLRAKGGGMTTDLELYDDNWLNPKLKLFGFIPIPLPSLKSILIKLGKINNQKLLLINYQKMQAPWGLEIQPYEISNLWKSRLGDYCITDKNDDFIWAEKIKVKIIMGYLTLSLFIKGQGPAIFTLRPIDNETVIIEGISRGCQESIYFETLNNNHQLCYSDIAYSKIK